MRSFCHLFTSCKFHCLFFSSKLAIKRNFSCVSTFAINMFYLTNFLFTQNILKFIDVFSASFRCFWFKLKNLFPFVFFVHVLPNLLRMQNDKLDFDPVYLLFKYKNYMMTFGKKYVILFRRKINKIQTSFIMLETSIRFKENIS